MASERPNPTEKTYAVERFSQYVTETTNRLNSLEQFLNQVVLDLEDVNKVNQKLIEANRPDLVIKNRVEFPQITDKKFPKNRRELPIFNNFSNRLLCLNSNIKPYKTEEFLKADPWPPKQRLLVLYPDFYIPFFEETLKESYTDHYEPEVYVAYQIISKLVDFNDDKDIRNKDGTLDTHYLVG